MVHASIHVHSHTQSYTIGTIGIGAGVDGHNISRKLNTAQLRYRTISDHVIAVSARQRVYEVKVDTRQVSCLHVFVVFDLFVFICSL